MQQENRSDNDSKEKKGRQSEFEDLVLSKLRRFSYILSVCIQYFVALTIIIAILITLWSLPIQFMSLTDVDSDSLIEFLKYTINIIIAVELIRVLCHQTLDTIVEILLIAITRELIIEHMSPGEMLLGVMAVAVLFVIRKYLFVSQLDKESRPDVFHSKHKEKAEPENPKPEPKADRPKTRMD